MREHDVISFIGRFPDKITTAKRELKFKAICQHDETGSFHSQHYGVSQAPVLPSDRYHWVVRDLQYTGDKDKSGNEVYDGHVLQDERGKKYQVKWGVNSSGFIAKTNESHCSVYSLYHIAPKTEIIGDIYENLGLMR